MSKHCLSQKEFERKVMRIVANINESRERLLEAEKELHKYTLELKSIQMKDDCEHCEHRVECLTTEQEEMSHG